MPPGRGRGRGRGRGQEGERGRGRGGRGGGRGRGGGVDGASSQNRQLAHKGHVVRVFNEKRFGFIKPDSAIPDLEEGKEIFFHFDNVVSGGLQIVRNDIVEFTLGKKQSDKGPSVFRGCLIQGRRRDAEQVTEYLERVDNILLSDKGSVGNIADSVESNGTKPEDRLGVLSCMASWKCVVESIESRENVLNLVSVCLTLDSQASTMKEHFRKLIHVIAFSSMLDAKQGALARFIDQAIHTADDYDIHMIQNFLNMTVKCVPEKTRAVVQLIQPFTEIQGAANYFYDLLKIISTGTASCVEDLDWNEIPLVPSSEEMETPSKALDLQPIKREGAYSSTFEYLETHFRLLRADCFDSLKKGVTDLLNGKLDKRDMNVYYDLHVIGLNVSRQNHLCLAVKLRSQDKKVNWDKTNKLMFGNLLGLSRSGQFDDIIWATVASREHLKTQQVVMLELCSEINTLSDADTIQTLFSFQGRGMAVESPTYYRAYGPILKALQKQDPDSLSFKDELVNLKQPTAADFITSQSTVKISPILSEDVLSRVEESSLTQRLRSLTSGSLSSHTIFDESQDKAIAETLKHKIGIVQGPPGTGKTFIGIKLTEILLSLSTKPSGPILVLTYKNHALDEFVKALIEAGCENIIRVGGSSKDPTLNSRNLNSKEREEKTSKALLQQIRQAQQELSEAEDEVKDAFAKLSKARILSLESFVSFVNGKQLADFLMLCPWQFGFRGPQKKQLAASKSAQVRMITAGLSYEDIKKAAENSTGSELQTVISEALDLWKPNPASVKTFEQSLSTALNWMSHDAAFRNDDQNEDVDSGDEKEVADKQNERMAAMNDGRSINLNHMLRFDSAASQDDIKLFSCAPELLQNLPTGVFNSIRDLWKLKEEDKIKLVQCMIFENFQKASENFKEKLIVFEQFCSAHEELRNQHKADILKRSSVVAMTITGASINYDLLQQLQPSIVLVEEAAELLESQLVAALGSWTKQLILIGDHKQLRPSVECYTLARDYNMDLSMMERLILNGFKYSTLLKQNRMRPEFAGLLKDIYPHLQSNLERVGKNEAPSCIAHSMYFWHHDDKETEARSFINEAEAARAMKLALFLVQQGTEPRKITILAAYLGQTSFIRKQMRAIEKSYVTDEENKIIVHTIDNYQGDENDVVIVSLVRSNEKGNIGFLKLLNRRCVAQSRAKCGLYFVGNFSTFQKNENWNFLLEHMYHKGLVGRSITLVCPKHAQSTKNATTAKDIDLGTFCTVICGGSRTCGHQCNSPCQPPHAHDVCQIPCRNPCEKCRGLCKKNCLPGHSHVMCDRVIDVPLQCLHSVKMKCSEDVSAIVCTENVSFVKQPCRHMNRKMCYENADDISCSEACPKVYPCGHHCFRKCGEECKPKECKDCKRIEAERAKREAEKQKKLREMRDAEVKKQIEEVKKKIAQAPTREELLKTGSTASEYLDIEDRVLKYIQPGHRWFPEVTKIEKVTNYKLEKNWLQAKTFMQDPDSRSELKFHGTTEDAIANIIKDGFRLPTQPGMYGKGIYFASDSSKSAQAIYTKGSDMLLLCDVLIGKTMTVDSPRSDMTATKLRAQQFDSVFAKRGTKGQGGVLFDEFVVFSPDQALPKYIIHYNKQNSMIVAKAAAIPPPSAGYACYRLKQTRSVNTSDPLEIHYRIAESQFLRLMNITGKKRKIISIHYHQNPALEASFKKKKREFKQKYPPQPPVGGLSQSDIHAPIYAFHGTKAASVQGIMKSNFDMTRISQNTGNPGQYGAGIYFSELPETCMHYGSSLILCQVLPGKCMDVTGKNVKGQPLIHGFDSHGAHPTKDGHFQIMVVFNKDQILPCYSIESVEEK